MSIDSVFSQSSSALFKRALRTIPGGVNSPVRAFRSVGSTPFFTRSADGSRLTTVDGQQLIDYVCTWGPAIHGHNHPEIKAAIATALEHGTSFGTPNPYEVAMAEQITTLVPSVEKVRMCNSGTEATMSAIRLARGYTGRTKVIKFAGCYHGHSDSLLVKAGSGALTHGHPDSAGIPAAFAAETIVIPFNDLDALQNAFAANSGQVAAVIVEPYPANVGLLLPLPNFLQALRRLCDQERSLLIFDEVMTGFRVALGGVQEFEAVRPDLTAFGKIIGGGLPVGAFGGRAEIMDLLSPDGPVYQAGTLSGNPLAMAAGLKALQILQSSPPFASLDRASEQIQKALLQAAHTKGIALQVPRCGSMFALFFSEQRVDNDLQAVASNRDMYCRVFHHALQSGVYLPPSPFETAFISTAHSPADIEQTCEVLTAGIKNL